MKHRRVILLLTAALALSTVTSGCSGDDGQDKAASEQDASSKTDETQSAAEDGQAESGADENSAADADTGAEENADAGMAEAEAAAGTETDADAGEAVAAPEEKEKEKKVVMYTTVNLILRKKGNMDAEKIEILPVNTKVTVLKKGKEWYKVKAGGKKGFVFAEYLTKSRKEAQAAEAAAAEAEAQAAAEAAAQAAAQNNYSAPQDNTGSSGGGKTEVSREDYPDCDGSGHGYSEIHYSDGSTEIVEY